MKLHTRLIKNFLSVFTPILTVSTVLASPSYAANFTAESFLASFGFSQEANDITTVTNTNSSAISGLDSSVNANAEANSTFLNSSGFDLECNNTEYIFRFSGPAGCNNTLATVTTEGNNVNARATSEAVFTATFSINPEATFSFDFLASLDLAADASDLTDKRFNTRGEISLGIYDLDTNTLLDSFVLAGQISPEGKNDFLLTSGTIGATVAGFDSSFLEGTYSRFFGTSTNLLLVGSNYTSITAVPEASQTLALLFVCGVFAAKTKLKNKQTNY
jgi:hypothetical protein